MSEPSFTVSANRVLWQICRSGTPAWWFDQDGRCHLAFDPLSALREVVGPLITKAVISATFLTERRLRRMSLPRPFLVGDSSGAIDPNQEGLRFSVGDQEGAGLAIFGLPGERKAWRRGKAILVPKKLLADLAGEAGVEVAPVPSSAQLRVIET